MRLLQMLQSVEEPTHGRLSRLPRSLWWLFSNDHPSTGIIALEAVLKPSVGSETTLFFRLKFAHNRVSGWVLLTGLIPRALTAIANCPAKLLIHD